MTREEFSESIPEMLREAMENMLMKAFDEGYKAGVESLQSEAGVVSQKKEEIKWIDLGLPSGNLWSYHSSREAYPKDDSYLPSEEDFRELLHGTPISNVYGGWLNCIYIKGPNGVQFDLARMNYVGALGEQKIYAWIKSEPSPNITHRVIEFTHQTYKENDRRRFKVEWAMGDIFAGENASILYCKHQ